MPDNFPLFLEGRRSLPFNMKTHKGIDPLQPGQWKMEPELQRRLVPQEHNAASYTNISDTCDHCTSSQAHVLGFAVTYHDYQTHNSYYGKARTTKRKKNIYLGWIEDCELRVGRPSEWNQKHEFGPEHPYHGIARAADIPDVIKTHAQIREDKMRAAREAPTSSPSEEPDGA